MKKFTLLVFALVLFCAVSYGQNNVAQINQMSDDNDAEITQEGALNSGFIKQSSYAERNDHTQMQNGDKNEASASVYADDIQGIQFQLGGKNVSALNQAASNSTAETYQAGYGQTARVHQSGGSDNSATVYQGLFGGEGSPEAGLLEDEGEGGFLFSEDNTVGIKQDGSGNEVTTGQLGVGNSAGSDWWSNLGIHQKGHGNDAVLGQLGYGHTASITQHGNRNNTTITQTGFGGGGIVAPSPVAQ